MENLFEKAKSAYGTGEYDDKTLEFLFPQLNECKDERIRKAILALVKKHAVNHERCQMEAYLEKQKEQKPNIKLIQCSWYMEGYHDRKFGKEPKWIIKTGEDGPEYEENPKYGQMLKEQKPAEWSEEDEARINHLVAFVEKHGLEYYASIDKVVAWLKDLPNRFVIQPKQEWSEFEQAYMRIVHKMKPEEFNDEGLKTAKENAAELLALAREQFIKDGYVIEKKAFHDAVENISDKHLAEMSVQYSIHCKVEDGTQHAIMNWDTFQKVAQKFIDIGKAEAIEKYKQFWFNEGKIAGRFEGLTKDKKYQQGVHNGKEEALKDLPMWKDNDSPKGSAMIDISGLCGFDFIRRNGKLLRISDLEKLPGFND